ncbi:hypothetical protein AB9H26_20540 [Yersinia enterocolitica]|uniref:hypothetical protein n=1 Tax=Yersinia TaxID=629 RepID=UPI0011A4809D|nr:hypothetical protein [Yersinia aleksiciae]MDA5499912.1 hypothetical protein [Yersinia aleksiciae]NIL01271.1 hypothetical protein [Yersinia aleksiciae]WQC71776.1 hypothetical protein N0K21_04750 [Yersinia aleksiciae]WQC72555.1 hypothetical protein N0K21_09190 [Yersinia aleksiciae]
MTNHSERTSNAKHPNSTKSANEKERFYNEKSEKISEIIGCIASTIEILIEKESDRDIGNAMSGVLFLLESCDACVDEIIMETNV